MIYYSYPRSPSVLDATAVDTLRDVVCSTGARVVLSSDRRRDPETRTFVSRVLSSRGVQVEGWQERGPAAQRSIDILKWVEAHSTRYTRCDPEMAITSFAVVDEKPLVVLAGGEHLVGRFVMTKFGLTGAAASALINCLKTPQEVTNNLLDDNTAQYSQYSHEFDSSRPDSRPDSRASSGSASSASSVKSVSPSWDELFSTRQSFRPSVSRSKRFSALRTTRRCESPLGLCVDFDAMEDISFLSDNIMKSTSPHSANQGEKNGLRFSVSGVAACVSPRKLEKPSAGNGNSFELGLGARFVGGDGKTHDKESTHRSILSYNSSSSSCDETTHVVRYR